MINEPKSHQQPDGQGNGDNGQPVPSSPPQGQEKTDTQGKAGDFAGDDVKPAEYQQSTDQRGPKIASWESDGTDSASHVRYSSLVRI